MTVQDQIAAELGRLAGFSGPGTAVASAAGPDGMTVEAELAAVDAVGCLVTEVRAEVPKLAGASFDVLKTWGEALSRRISYLLETLGLLEADEEHGQVLIRSNPPDRQGSATAYYEVLLREDGPGRFSLRRYEAQKGSTGRVPVEMHLTHQVLKRLARDLVETVPAGP
ncbi:MAG: hypothetical protein M3552_12765 [Planctomycetota bacterium]|nr:hypothetical protein [Planctomycetaceae bacterium]MDQ3331505.1 hypothetical protein [Planctomycetota bacterium]